MNKPVVLGLIGAAFYLGFVVFDFVQFAGGGWLDINELYISVLPILALFFLFASSAGLKLRTWPSAFLNLSISTTVIFGFPNISFPVGDTYFGLLQVQFGHLSLFMAFFTLVLFIHFYTFGREHEDT